MFKNQQAAADQSHSLPCAFQRTGRRSWVLLALVLGLLLVPWTSPAQTTLKTVEGKVLASGSTPLPGSIVYLQDTRTNVVKTLIATADGSYHFGQLPADTDYQLWAEFKGKKSKNHMISSFDTKKDVTYNFHIDDK